jgi:hypothetical protein
VKTILERKRATKPVTAQSYYRTSNRTMDVFISHSLLYSSLAGSQKNASLTDLALLIQCSAKKRSEYTACIKYYCILHYNI